MTSETVDARIALWLPPFWKSNVRLRIAQCDQNAFTFSGISSDDTEYSAIYYLDAETFRVGHCVEALKQIKEKKHFVFLLFFGSMGFFHVLT
ncbi:hypothetical protein TNCV_2178621 [Trichonephila clavipes]|uniref:Uncharacterized protein n=1 Tax=Trichonephila clavipes TaxID=2585209 RepID=A0A8X6VUC0_TRICX|nr:hypothetical protein TNCV_2178621 [Trichonephila clavipes]